MQCKKDVLDIVFGPFVIQIMKRIEPEKPGMDFLHFRE